MGARRAMTRRVLLAGGAGGAAVVAAAATGVRPNRRWLKDERHHSYGNGAHTRAYWDSVTLPAFAFLGDALRSGAAA